MTETSRAERKSTQATYLKAFSNYVHYRPRPAEAWRHENTARPAEGWRHEDTHKAWAENWEPHVRPTPLPMQPQVIDLGWGTGQDGVVIDHGRRVVIDDRRDVNAQPKLIVELSADEKDVIIQCRCGDRISLVKLLGLEAVKPIFDGISGRIRGLIEGMKPEQPA